MRSHNIIVHKCSSHCSPLDPRRCRSSGHSVSIWFCCFSTKPLSLDQRGFRFESQDWYDDWTVNVVVKGVGTEPVISIEGYSEGGISLLCESEGWYPEPQVVWMDSEGQSLPAAPTETHTDSTGLFTVRRHVHQQVLLPGSGAENIEASRINNMMDILCVPGEMFHRAHPWKVSFAVFFTLAVLLLAQSAVLIYRCVKLRRKKGAGFFLLTQFLHHFGHLTIQGPKWC
ncbi:butyrophilin subfamily 3 member A2-like [Arapaima gigas]